MIEEEEKERRLMIEEEEKERYKNLVTGFDWIFFWNRIWVGVYILLY